MLYLTSTTGIMVGQHLCMGRLKQASLFTEVKKDCGMSMDMHGMMDDCCDDELVLEIVDDSQQQVLSEEAPAADYSLLYDTAFSLLVDLHSVQENDVELNDSGPPDLGIPDRYILFHNLKIPAALQS